MYISV